MPELGFQVGGAKVGEAGAIPSILMQLKIENMSAGERIQSVLLRSQVQIEAPRRRYSQTEQAKLRDLFGDPSEWGRALKPLLWANTTNIIGAFERYAAVDVTLPCTIDFHASVSAYFQAIEEGTIPLTLLFSGTVFYQASSGSLQVAPISWNCETRFPFPVALWTECLNAHYANTVWLPIRRDLYARLHELKAHWGLVSLDEAMERAIAHAREVAA